MNTVEKFLTETNKTSQIANKAAKIRFYMEEYKTILKKTDGGLDIFSYYLGKECLKKKFKSVKNYFILEQFK